MWDYAHQRIAAEQLREVQEYLRSQIPWKSLSSQRMDLGAELLNFWCGEDELDWGYSQYFEIAAGNLKPFLAMTLFTEILCKHFPDVMSAPVKRVSNKLLGAKKGGPPQRGQTKITAEAINFKI